MVNQKIPGLSNYCKDLTGQRFGQLVALRPIIKRIRGKVAWSCRCDCGKKILVPSDSLRSGNTKSCGCWNQEQSARRAIKRNTTHGYGNHPLYKVWHHMIQRCENPKDKAYKWYGGRGIAVCEEWRYNLIAFCNWGMLNGYKEGLTLDRWPDNDGPYRPNNCRWATAKEQRANSRPMSCGKSKQYWFFAFNLNTGEWDEDNSQHGFARKWNLNQGHISSCLLGKERNHKGWIFKRI